MTQLNSTQLCSYTIAIASTIAIVTFHFFLSLPFFFSCAIQSNYKLFDTFPFRLRRVEINRQIIIKLPSIWISARRRFFLLWHGTFFPVQTVVFSPISSILFFGCATNDFDFKSMLICYNYGNKIIGIPKIYSQNLVLHAFYTVQFTVQLTLSGECVCVCARVTVWQIYRFISHVSHQYSRINSIQFNITLAQNRQEKWIEFILGGED